ncbi:hypothetical protein MMC20_007617 [Loxospora ochrophaea]|nr:hypothetical protein [Loxospora ochrophaea]
MSSSYKQQHRNSSLSSATAQGSDIEQAASQQGYEKQDADPGFIDWDGPHDPEHPQNWSTGKKIWATLDLALLNLVFTVASSILGSGDTLLAAEFNVSSEVTILGISLFLLGFTVGPPFWGPLSERFGRKTPLVLSVFLASVFSVMVASAHSIATVLIGRFIAGSFGVAPIAILGGSVTDNWNAINRGPALASVMSMVFSGPLLGPVLGGFITSSSLGWRWTMWIVAIFGFAVSGLSLIALPETYPPILLARKAERLRKETGSPKFWCEYERQSRSISSIARVYLVRPWNLFFTEPILVLITLYQSFIFGLLYLFSQSYSIAFEEVRQWQHDLGSLPLLALIVGVAAGLFIIIVHTKTRFARITAANGGVIVPEHRLPMMIFGGCVLPVGLFWFAWTSDPSIPWPSMVTAGVLIGCGLFIIFVQCFGYIIDVYLSMANSALAANTFLRSLWAAGFPLFAPAMYHHLGIAWASSLLAFLSILMMPVPIIFYLYGERIRGWSKNTNKAT